MLLTAKTHRNRAEGMMASTRFSEFFRNSSEEEAHDEYTTALYTVVPLCADAIRARG